VPDFSAGERESGWRAVRRLAIWRLVVLNFKGQMASHTTGDHYHATVAVDGEMVRIWNDHKRVGAWPVGDVNCERVTVFRFHLTLDGVVYTFQPEDPGGFANEVGAIIDLRPTTRFGLGPRVQKAKEELAAARSTAEDSAD
jgi:hypothetical protein